MLVHLDLFSGIGGFALACQWAGIKTIGFVEIDKYCQKVLRKHWPSVPIVEDIRDVEKIKEIVADTRCGKQGECSNANKVSSRGNSEKRPTSKAGRPSSTSRIILPPKRKGRESPTILITGGFPCQPFSVAGKRRGMADNRYLWNEMFAVIKAVKPAWVLAENVAGIAGMEFTDSVSDLESEVPEEVEAELSAVLDRVCSDLEEVGYEVQPIIIPACAVNAPHRRDRVWIVANSNTAGQSDRSKEYRGKQAQGRKGKRGSGRCSIRTIADTQEQGLEGGIGNGRGTNDTRLGQGSIVAEPTDWWAVEPELGRVAHGIPNRVDRLKCLGNAIVPQVAYEIIKGIADYEDHSLQDQH